MDEQSVKQTFSQALAAYVARQTGKKKQKTLEEEMERLLREVQADIEAAEEDWEEACRQIREMVGGLVHCVVCFKRPCMLVDGALVELRDVAPDIWERITAEEVRDEMYDKFGDRDDVPRDVRLPPGWKLYDFYQSNWRTKDHSPDNWWWDFCCPDCEVPSERVIDCPEGFVPPPPPWDEE